MLDPDGRTPTSDQAAFLTIFGEQEAADPSHVHAQTLLQAFRDNRISGGSAKERLQSILTLTGTPGRSPSGDTAAPSLHFNAIVTQIGTDRAADPVGDRGLRAELRDSVQYQTTSEGEQLALSPRSSNQIGHFLTAAHIGLAVGEGEVYAEKEAAKAADFEKKHPLRALLGDLLGRTSARVDTRLSIEAQANAYVAAAVDAKKDASATAPVRSLAGALLTPSSDDVRNFLAGRLDRIKINDAPDSGNSYQDLLLTFVGFKFGKKVARNEFASAAEAGRYLELMLTGRDLSAVTKSDPFYKDVQEFQQLLQQFKDTQNRIHPSSQHAKQ